MSSSVVTPPGTSGLQHVASIAIDESPGEESPRGSSNYRNMKLDTTPDMCANSDALSSDSGVSLVSVAKSSGYGGPRGKPADGKYPVTTRRLSRKIS